MKKRILLVDDERRVLDSMREMLHPMRKGWEMEFANSGHEALAILAQTPVDVVVTDVRMADMSGNELLTEVMQTYPNVVRIILSSQYDKSSMMTSIGSAHQYLSKPCNPEKLQRVIENAFTMRQLLANDKLRKLVSNMKTLPSMPTLYLSLMEELASANYTLTRVGQIIAKDVGLTAKLLQLVNSAFFGLRVRVSNPVYAARLLGPEIIKGLVFSVEVFSKFKKLQSSCLSLEKFLGHSMAVGSFAKEIAIREGLDQVQVDNAFIAGMLHDSGKLVLAENLPDLYKKSLELALHEGLTIMRAEEEVIGASHAEVGAYLLGLWGLPKDTVDSAAFHHRPTQSWHSGFNFVTAVHVANAMEHELDEDGGGVYYDGLNLDYLEQAGLVDRVSEWRELCLEVKEKAALN